jgi:putative ABC transport system substrate-binding protein
MYQKQKSFTALSVCALCLMLVLLSGCGGGQKNHVVGFVTYNKSLEGVMPGVKEGLTALGYVEGKNVQYLYNGVVAADPASLDAEISKLVGLKVDLLVTMGSLPTAEAKKVVTDQKLPIIFGPTTNPLKLGVIQSLAKPGFNLTGVQALDVAPVKALEWYLKIMPNITKVYVPFNPADGVTVAFVEGLRSNQGNFKIQIAFTEVKSAAQVLTDMNGLGKNAGVLLFPMPSIDKDLQSIIDAAKAARIPLGQLEGLTVDHGALFQFAVDYAAIGKQQARLIDQIWKGASPAEIPVETAEMFLNVNMKTAAALGVTIPEDILRQAKTVIR